MKGVKAFTANEESSDQLMNDVLNVGNGMKTMAQLKGKIDCCLPKANLRWDDCLLLSHYGEDKTFVLMTDGTHLVVEQSLRESINAFARFNVCHQSNICPGATLFDRPVRGIVAGMNRLLPTSGLHNPNLVYYMARFLLGYVYLPQTGEICLHFVNDHLNCRIAIPAYQETFNKILQEADELSSVQLSLLHYFMHCYAYQHKCTQLTNDYHRSRQMREKAIQWEETKLLWIVNEAYKICYGQAMEEEMRAELITVMEKCYQTK